MMHLVKRLLSGDFARNVSVMLAGIIIGQLISVGSLIVLSKLYTVSDIGVLTLFLNAQGFFGILATLTYDSAVMLPKDDDEAMSIIRLCMQWTLVVCVLAILPVVFCYHFEVFGKDCSWLFAIPLSILVFGFLLATWAYHHRRKQFALVATNKILQSLAIAAFQIAMFRFGADGLVWGLVLGLLLSLLLLWWRESSFLRGLFARRENNFVGEMKAIALKYKQFPMYSAPNALLNHLSGFIPELMLSYFYGLEAVALFAVGKRMVHMPVNVLVSAMAKVFYQKSNDLYREKPQELLYFCRKVYRNNLVIGILPATVLWLIAPYLFQLLFGSQWREAGVFTQYLIPWLFMVLLNGPLESVIHILGKQKEQFWLQLELVLVRVISIFAGYYFWNSAHMSALLFGVVGFVYQCFMSWYLFKIIREKALA